MLTRERTRARAEHGDARLLVIDDAQPNLDLMARILRRAGYDRVQLTTDPRWAVDHVLELQPDLVVLDLHMPGMDGLEVLRCLQQRIPADDLLPRLVITADSTGATRREALALGAHDFLTKPIDLTETTVRIANLLRTRMLHVRLRTQKDRLEEQVRARTRELEDAYGDVLRRLALMGEYRDDDTAAHTARVGVQVESLALALGQPADRAALLGRASTLHDIGKVAIPDAILMKTGPLTAAEFSVMTTHATIGARMLGGSRAPVLQLAERIALSHHERWDGSGYPAGLAGLDIPVEGRIVAVVDVHDALSTSRPYKNGWSPDRVRDEMLTQRGRHFDPAVLDVFLDLVAADAVADPFPEPFADPIAAPVAGQLTATSGGTAPGSATTNVVPTDGRLSTSR